MEEKHRDRIRQNLDQLVSETKLADLEKMLEILEQKRIFNQWMLNAIRTSDNRQKEFYERIQKRGPSAFKILQTALSAVGLHELSLLLGGNKFLRECNYSNSNDKNFNESDGNCNFKSKKEFKEDFRIVDPGTVYEIKSKPKGLVLIVNIKNFKFRHGHNRKGSDNDVHRLKKVWTNLGFEVKIKEDLTSEELKRYIGIFVQKEKLRLVDSAFVFIMSHGKPDPKDVRAFLIECADSKYIPSEEILSQFNSIHCPALVEKPKAIFFQACRGDCKDFGVAMVMDSAAIDNSAPRIKIVPSLTDMYVTYSTSPGNVSYRDENNGGYFTQEFCNVLEARSSRLDLVEVINEVSRRLQALAKDNQMAGFQVPHSENLGFTKHVYLND